MVSVQFFVVLLCLYFIGAEGIHCLTGNGGFVTKDGEDCPDVNECLILFGGTKECTDEEPEQRKYMNYCLKNDANKFVVCNFTDCNADNACTEWVHMNDIDAYIASGKPPHLTIPGATVPPAGGGVTVNVTDAGGAVNVPEEGLPDANAAEATPKNMGISFGRPTLVFMALVVHVYLLLC